MSISSYKQFRKPKREPCTGNSVWEIVSRPPTCTKTRAGVKIGRNVQRPYPNGTVQGSRKNGGLQQYIANAENKSDSLAIPETNSRPELPEYIAYTNPSEKSTGILVRSNIAVTQHMTCQRGRQHVLLEIHSRSIGNKDNTFILNAYCRHYEKYLNIEGRLRHSKGEAGSRPVLILGNFNAPHSK